MERSNISNDLIWEVVRNQNAYLVKRNHGGGVQFSRDPYNLTNKHSRKHSGFVNDKAVAIAEHNGGIRLHTKKNKASHTPGSHNNTHSFGAGASNRKIYKSVADHTGKNSYRSDLNRDAIARASAIRYSQKPKKDALEKKPRGAKAKKIEE